MKLSVNESIVGGKCEIGCDDSNAIEARSHNLHVNREPSALIAVPPAPQRQGES